MQADRRFWWINVRPSRCRYEAGEGSGLDKNKDLENELYLFMPNSALRRFRL